jgi:hypothetical protein
MHLTKYLLPALFVFLIACNSSTKNENQQAQQDVQYGEFLKQHFGQCDTISGGGIYADVDVWLPADSTSEAAKNIRFQLQNKLVERINSYSDSASLAKNPAAKNSVKAAFEVFEHNYKDFKKQFPEAPGCWFVELKGDTIMTTGKVLVYQLDHFANTGGAHPNTFRSLHIFDATTGQEKDSKLFVADSTALTKKVEAAFRKVEKLDDSVNLEENGYFLSDHKFFIPANYTFTKDGVLFFYNPYEIAPYARGPIEFTIPYNELEGIVKKDLLF